MDKYDQRAEKIIEDYEKSKNYKQLRKDWEECLELLKKENPQRLNEFQAKLLDRMVLESLAFSILSKEPWNKGWRKKNDENL